MECCRRDEEEEEGSEKCPVNNGTVTPVEEVVVEQEEQGATNQSREGEGEAEGAGAVIDLSAAVPSSNKRLREGKRPGWGTIYFQATHDFMSLFDGGHTELYDHSVHCIYSTAIFHNWVSSFLKGKSST